VQEAEELRVEHPGCGVEKIYDTLLPPFIGRDKFVDIFMDLGFRVKHPKNYTRTTFSVNYDYPNLIEGMLVSNINQVVQSDITKLLYTELIRQRYNGIFVVGTLEPTAEISQRRFFSCDILRWRCPLKFGTTTLSNGRPRCTVQPTRFVASDPIVVRRFALRSVVHDCRCCPG